MVESFRFLGVQITNNLSWSPPCQYSNYKSPLTPLLSQKTIRKFGTSTMTLTNFYRCTIKSILHSCITAWYGSCSVQDRKELQKVMNVAQSITQTSLPSIDSVYASCCLGKAASIIKNPTHPGHSLFHLLPLGKRYKSLYQLTQEQLLPCCCQTFEWTYLALS